MGDDDRVEHFFVSFFFSKDDYLRSRGVVSRMRKAVMRKGADVVIRMG